MKKIIFTALIALGLSGCATTQSGAALSGAIVGAAIGVMIAEHPHEQHHHTHRYYSCRNERIFVGYDRYGVPISTVVQICR